MRADTAVATAAVLAVVGLPGCLADPRPQPPDLTDYHVRADEVGAANGSVADVSPLPPPVARAVAEAARPNDTDGGDASVSREAYRDALAAFGAPNASREHPPTRYRTHVRRNGTLYRVTFRVLGEG